MKFRKLYWVTEQIDESGQSSVAGVYTSIFDLTNKGLRWDEEISGKAGFRVTLVKLDSGSKPLGSWTGDEFAGMGEDLQPYVTTGEFDGPAVDNLVEELNAFVSGIKA